VLVVLRLCKVTWVLLQGGVAARWVLLGGCWYKVGAARWVLLQINKLIVYTNR